MIEKVSDQSFPDYVQEHVFNPAGMNATSAGTGDKPIPNLSVDYTRTGAAGWIPITDAPINSGSSAGAGFSTAGDLLRFANALRENKLLDAQQTKLMTTGRVKNPFGLDAYGFGVQTINGTECFGHNGSGRGVNGDLEMCLNSKYSIVVLANMDPPAAEQVSSFIMGRLPASKP